MKRRNIQQPGEGFEVIAGSGRSQAARMALAPNESVGGPDNRHPASDQWLLVLGGAGHALIGERRVPLKAGALVLIEAGETHEIVNDTNDDLQTLNFYAPPAY